MLRKFTASLVLLSYVLLLVATDVALADNPLTSTPRRMGELTAAEQQAAAERNQNLINDRNAAMALPQLNSSNPSVELEADYILLCQFMNQSDFKCALSGESFC